jgi:predicted GIY-YIG superfamily endonuclease
MQTNLLPFNIDLLILTPDQLKGMSPVEVMDIFESESAMEMTFDHFTALSNIDNDAETVVYKAENLNTKEFYIGATTQKNKRIAKHIRSLATNTHNPNGEDLFQKAYNRDPNFIFTVIPVDTKNEAFELEKQLIKHFRGDQLCLNMTGSVLPPDVTDETRAKISIAVKAHYANCENNTRIGRKLSEDHKKKISEGSIKNWEDPEYRMKLMTFLTSDQFRKKIGDVHRGKVESDETRLKKSLSKKGIPQSPELIEKRAAALRGRSLSPPELIARTENIRKKIENLSEAENQNRLEQLARQSVIGANKVRRSIEYNGTIYSSISEAIQAEKISSATMYKRLKQQGYKVRT